jgi:histidyl-tRNA synthetase
VREKQSAEAAPVLRPDLFIAAADDPGRQWAFANLVPLRTAGVSVETDFLGRSLKSQMREADRQQAHFVLVVGQSEVSSGRGTLKNLSNGTQTAAEFTMLAATVRQLAGAAGVAAAQTNEPPR